MVESEKAHTETPLQETMRVKMTMPVALATGMYSAGPPCAAFLTASSLARHTHAHCAREAQVRATEAFQTCLVVPAVRTKTSCDITLRSRAGIPARRCAPRQSPAMSLKVVVSVARSTAHVVALLAHQPFFGASRSSRHRVPPSSCVHPGRDRFSLEGTQVISARNEGRNYTRGRNRGECHS